MSDTYSSLITGGAQGNTPTSLISGGARETIPAIRDDSDFAKIRPGQKYIAPDGQTYTKLYTVEHDEDFADVPEGAKYVGPDGETYTKPSFAPVSGTAQMLYDMAQDDDTKEQALRTIYGDKVKRDELGTYVEDEKGVLRKPGERDLATRAGAFVSGVAPAAGMVGGGLLGGALGSVEPGGGTAAGGFVGAVGGAAVGRQFNNIILSLFGVRQPLSKQVNEMAWEGAGAAIGEPVGKLAGAAIGGARALAGKVQSGAQSLGGTLGEKLPTILESFGITPEKFHAYTGATGARAERVQSLAEKGYQVPPKASMPHFPMLGKMQEFYDIFHPGARDEANEAVANQEMRRIMESEEIGLKLTDLPTQETKAVSSKEAGQLSLDAAHQELAQANAEIENTTRDMKTLIRPTFGFFSEMHQEATRRLGAEQQRAMTAAETLIRGGVSTLRQEAEAALTLAGHGEDPSALNRMVDGGFRQHDRAIRAQARTFYSNARAAYEGAPPPDVSGLASQAESFLRALPEAMRNKYPTEIAELARLVDRDVEIPGVTRTRPLAQGQHESPIDYADLHHLRSWLRHGIDYNDLTPDMRAGALKHFEREVNRILHDPNAPPEVRQAAVLLDQADAFYRQNVPFLGDEMVTRTLKALESGAGVNPEVIAHLLFDPKRTAALRRARSILGESTWRTVEAAHTAHLVDNSRIVTGQVDFTRFHAQVEDLVRNNVIETGYSPRVGRQLRQLATQMGQFKGSIPIDVGDTDTLSMIMRRGAAVKEEGARLAETDPINVLSKEIERLDKEMEATQKDVEKTAKEGPLGFLYQNSMSEMAATAADKILDNQDLSLAFARMFPRDSSQFRAMQQVYVQRFFQRPYSKLGEIRAEIADPKKGVTEEIQALWFPGVTKDMMVQFAKDMEFLSEAGGTDIGGSLAGAGRVLHPLRHLPFPLNRPLTNFFGHMPGVAFAHRLALGRFYKLIMEASADPSFAAWMAGKLKGGAAERIAVRQTVQNRLQMSGFAGAAVGQQVLGGASQEQAQEPSPEAVE